MTEEFECVLVELTSIYKDLSQRVYIFSLVTCIYVLLSELSSQLDRGVVKCFLSYVISQVKQKRTFSFVGRGSCKYTFDFSDYFEQDS